MVFIQPTTKHGELITDYTDRSTKGEPYVAYAEASWGPWEITWYCRYMSEKKQAPVRPEHFVVTGPFIGDSGRIRIDTDDAGYEEVIGVVRRMGGWDYVEYGQ